MWMPEIIIVLYKGNTLTNDKKSRGNVDACENYLLTQRKHPDLSVKEGRYLLDII